MKRLIVVAISSVLATGVFALSLAEATGKIVDIVNAPAQMGEIMKSLDKDEQTEFLARVNKAIASTKHSADAKTESFLAVNKAALLANKGNVKELLAEVYATVPPASLTVINERLAQDLFRRDANPSKPISDEEMKKRAVETMKVVQVRNVGNDNASVRDTFAILMFLRAANGTPADLKDVLVSGLTDPEARELASTLWIPSAMGEGTAKSYDPMLGVSDVDSSEVPSAATNFLNPQGPAVLTGTLMADLSATVSKSGTPTVSFNETFLDPNKYALPDDGVGGLNRTPRSLDPSDPWYPGHSRGYRGQTER